MSRITDLKDPKDTKSLVKFYKGYVVHNIWKFAKTQGTGMTKNKIDQDIKANAHFPYDSCADPKVTIQDMQNLIAWGFTYGDAVGIELDYPAEPELDGKIDLNFNRCTN